MEGSTVTMRFGLRVPACESADRVADLIARAERGGFDYAWVPDTQLLNREVWVTLGVAAARTTRIVLGTNVTNPLTRHATVTASAAATMDELTGGRFILGIGTGESSVRVMGWKTARLAQVREYIELMRPLWEGRWVAPDGPSFHLKHATGRRVPIYIAASRPKLLQMAGEIADGVIKVTGISKAALEYGLANIEIGATRSATSSSCWAPATRSRRRSSAWQPTAWTTCTCGASPPMTCQRTSATRSSRR